MLHSEKLCECGCGQHTRIATRTDTRAGQRKGQALRFIDGHSLKGDKRGDKSPTWKGGRVLASNGYVWVARPGHPKAQHGYIGEHVDMAEKALGRVLPDGVEVHHVDENKANNVPDNLVICENRAYHGLLHKRARALAACGDASALRCYFCHTYDNQDDIYVTSQGKPRHRACERQWRERRATA
jgi:hypothetical protein